MRVITVVFFVLLFTVRMDAQQDTMRSSVSVYAGGGFGLGYLIGGFRDLPGGYDDLQYEPSVYVDAQLKAGMLWKERIGFCVVAGQLGRTTSGNKFNEYASTAFEGYSFLPEYSDLHYGYVYRYITPQFVYRFGREPFNMTINVGYGLGYSSNANGIAIFKENGSNNFIECRYQVNNSLVGNIAAGLEFAYYRQLSQHWFLNTGFYINYNGVRQSYEIHYDMEEFSTGVITRDGTHVNDIIHHGAAGVFINFQWTSKEYPRAYYE